MAPPPGEHADDDVVARALHDGEVELRGRMPWSSNGTFLVEICHPALSRPLRAVYKPHRGELPLWDFPDGLYKREVAAYELSNVLGFDVVPLTIVRTDGPLGVGSLQRFVDADFEQHYFTLREDEHHHDAFRKLCALDIVANNTDRKSGHVLVDTSDRIWGIDNGLSFHAEFKLRTVIWDFADEPLGDEVTNALQRLCDEGLGGPLAVLLDPFERDAVLTRANALLREGAFPFDETGRRYPWPLV